MNDTFTLETLARETLRDAVLRGSIWRINRRNLGVRELLDHALLVKVKETTTRILYEPTEAGRFVALQLPTPNTEWQYAFSSFQEYNSPDHIRHRKYSLPDAV